MSRIGLKPVVLPEGVSLDIKEGVVAVKGPKGELSVAYPSCVSVSVENGVAHVARKDESPASVTNHGTVRANLANAVKGVHEGFKKELEIVGVGYRATMKNPQTLELALGFSHVIYLKLPNEVKGNAVTERNKNPLITLESCDKQLLGQICAKIRSFRKPEPYKGKGVKFVGEVIRRKSGKTAAAK